MPARDASNVAGTNALVVGELGDANEGRPPVAETARIAAHAMARHEKRSRLPFEVICGRRNLMCGAP
jgi:hypothetical protein